MKDSFWGGFIAGAAIFALLMGWLSTERLRHAEQRLWQQQVNVSVADQVLLYDAFKLAVSDPRDRAAAGAQAVHDTMKRAKEKR